MPKILIRERYDYQRNIIDYLVNENDFIERQYNEGHYDQVTAMDKELFLDFIKDTQNEEYQKVYSQHGTNTDDIIISKYNHLILSKNGMTLDALKHGFDVGMEHFDLLFTKPTTDINTKAIEDYQKNRFSVMEEVYHKDGERIDLVIFLNGIPLFAIELKANTSGQSYKNAIKQWRNDRTPTSRLLKWKKGALVYFAVDFKRAYMTTHLEKQKTFFLPFNKGDDESGIGNAPNPDGFGVSYLWEDIFTKDMILLLLTKYIFLEQKPEQDEKTGKIKMKERLIFPRFHQLRAVRKLIADMKNFGTDRNYLIQHSAGSGKTNTIAWLSHQLANLKVDNTPVVDSVIIITDRIIVDRQLQAAIEGLEHKQGLIKVMDEDATSNDLVDALNGRTRIVVSTIHKFSYILDTISSQSDNNFAVIIDEAHSSTAGTLISNVNKVLGKQLEENEEDGEIDDLDLLEALVAQKIGSDLDSRKKQPNVSMIAFTATPKPKTLKKFGTMNVEGQPEPFDLYSMKQAIEEGFILDVLKNYYKYDTYVNLIQRTQNDELFETSQAKRWMKRFVETHDTYIGQKVEVIIEHFREEVMDMLDGQAKAMVVTSSREAAYKYYNTFNQYIVDNGYQNIKPLVAFSGKLKVDGITEVSVNGFSEEELPSRFNTDKYQVLLVANKYQTGFDQPKLVAMYVDKILRGVTAVQTLSRLNRTYKGKTKTVVLDFVNSYDDIEKAFSKYYMNTKLTRDINPRDIFKLKQKIDLRNILDADDMHKFTIIYYTQTETKGKSKAEYYLDKAVTRFNSHKSEEERENMLKELRAFNNFYDFLTQVTSFKDNGIHEMYLFIHYLIKEIEIGTSEGIDLTGKIDAKFGKTKLVDTHETPDLKGDAGDMGLPGADAPTIQRQFKKLSDLIAGYNELHGTNFDAKSAIKIIEQTIETLANDIELRQQAKVNTLNDFKSALSDKIDEAIMESTTENQSFNNKLLSSEDLKNSIFGVFSEDLYSRLREE
ncbi:type I restriction endonuclease subunit R [Lysinibacillus xylanilyticus]|uniref:type I restriction endonuclease subunit R n=1 Tax=Lysinibacillus xylanilyticus TaxID=582475 RepID=UPI0037F1BA54